VLKKGAIEPQKVTLLARRAIPRNDEIDVAEQGPHAYKQTIPTIAVL
jgi:hypothetical protein